MVGLASTKKENSMSSHVRPYEPLTSEDAALVLVDHLVGLMTGGLIRLGN